MSPSEIVIEFIFYFDIKNYLLFLGVIYKYYAYMLRNMKYYYDHII